MGKHDPPQFGEDEDARSRKSRRRHVTSVRQHAAQAGHARPAEEDRARKLPLRCRQLTGLQRIVIVSN